MSEEYNFQLFDAVTDKSMTPAGSFKVVETGTASIVAITDTSDVSITQPGTISNGLIQFRVADAIGDVDIYYKTDADYCGVIQTKNFAGQNRKILVDTGNLNQLLQIPMRVGASYDGAAATELDTGFDLTSGTSVLPLGAGMNVITLDATETVDIGILSSESGGDANGFAALLSAAAAGKVNVDCTVTAGVVATAPTRGAMLADHADGTNADDRGIHQLRPLICDGTAVSVTATFTTGSDTAAVILQLPLLLPIRVST